MIVSTKSVLFAALTSASIFAQGSLTPPSGPAPSMKTLGQIEPRIAIDKLPYRVTASGAYYVTTNLSLPSGANGITVDADNVTLDLSGFTLRGAGDFDAAIAVVSGRGDVTIRNGAIASAGAGVEGSAAVRSRVESVRVSNCLGVGITLGAEGVVNNCDVTDNAATGIRVGVGGMISSCRVSGSGANGIETDQKSTVRDCTSTRNGSHGISAADFSKVIASLAADNNGIGINAGGAVHVTDCTANANRQNGINAAQWSFITHASGCWNAQVGIMVGDSVSILDSSTSGNGMVGISAGNFAQIANCKADANLSTGIVALKGSNVRDCSVQRNTGDGISVTEQCTVIRNNANNNSNLKGAAGIHVKGTDNVIQENSVAINDRGLGLDVEGNLVVKNTATNNSLNFYIVGEQIMGPVVTGFVTGEVTNPMSNFQF